MKTKNLIQVFFALFIATILGAINPALGAVAGLGVIAPKPTGSLGTGGIQVEIWHNFIIENIFKDNSFFEAMTDVSGFVMGGKIVHIPQAGTPSQVIKNRETLPASVTRRSDTDITYALDEYTTDPRVITNADKVELSYDKMNSVVGEDVAYLKEVIADNVLYNLAPAGAAQIIRTTGDAKVATLDGATGNRKKMKATDVKSAMTKFNKQNVLKTDRFAVISSDMFDELLDDLANTQYKDFSMMMDAVNGRVLKLYTFTIFERSSTLRYTNEATPVVKALDVANATTDNDCSIFWQKNCVEKAVGEIKVFEELNNPTMYGDTYSFLVRMGARKRRADGKGIVALVQAAA